ncbi:MAG TPA: hypothetical protein VFY92_02505, partial [Hyphomicrobiaceae bacterium]|nr:hypothetical protein [Hyphomicrobiaceae bacterium]
APAASVSSLDSSSRRRLLVCVTVYLAWAMLDAMGRERGYPRRCCCTMGAQPDRIKPRILAGRQQQPETVAT